MRYFNRWTGGDLIKADKIGVSVRRLQLDRFAGENRARAGSTVLDTGIEEWYERGAFLLVAR